MPEDFNADGSLKSGIPSQEGVGAVTLHPGDIKYVDVNHDGVITEEDEGYIGGTEDPRIVYGFGGVVSYKSIDFNFFFQGSSDMYRVIGGQPYFLPGGGTTTEGNAYSKNIDDRCGRNQSISSGVKPCFLPISSRKSTPRLTMFAANRRVSCFRAKSDLPSHSC